MAYNLSRYEQEVIITFNAEEETAELYTANPVWIRKMDKLVEQNPEQFQEYRRERMDGKVISKSYRFPKRFVTVRSKDKKIDLSDEQRKVLAESMRSKRQNTSFFKEESQKKDIQII